MVLSVLRSSITFPNDKIENKDKRELHGDDSPIRNNEIHNDFTSPVSV